MYRNLEKAIQEYKEQYFNYKTGKGTFYQSDIEQLVEMHGGYNECHKNLFSLIADSLEAGYAIGYRTAQRDQRAIKKAQASVAADTRAE